MNKNYLFLSPILLFLVKACLCMESQDELGLMIAKAIDEEKLIVSDSIDKSETPAFKLTTKAFKEDDFELLQYLLDENLLGEELVLDRKLVHIAIKKNSQNILRVFQEYKLFEEIPNELKKSYMLKAIRKDASLIYFLLEDLNWEIDVTDSDFLSAAGDVETIKFLMKKGFLLDESARINLFKKGCRQNNRALLSFVLKLDSYFLENNLAMVINIAISNNCRNALELLFDFHYFDGCEQQEVLAFLLSAIKIESQDCIKFFLHNFDLDQTNFSATFESHNFSNPVILKKKKNKSSYRLSQALNISSSRPESYMSLRLAPKVTIEKGESIGLQLAITQSPQSLKTIKNLLDLGANPNFTDKNGMTFLMHATLGSHTEIVDELLKHEADRTMQDRNGRTALMLATYEAHLPIMMKLLDFGNRSPRLIKQEVDYRDYEGSTALMYAATQFCPEAISLLLQADADASIVNTKNETVLSMLAKRTEKDIYQKIRKNCAQFMNKYQKIDEDLQTSVKIVGLSSHRNQSDKYNIYLMLSKILELEEITESEFPLQALSKIFKDTEYEEEAELCELYDQLLKQEEKNIFECCNLIIGDNKKLADFVIKGDDSLFKHAIVNNNVGAIKAFLPFISKKELKAADQWAIINNPELQKLLKPESNSGSKFGKWLHRKEK